MKKTFRRIAIYSLTGGASLYLGLLSLGGMYALVPLVPLAALSFVLSVAYEGEIYLQNLTQAVMKLLKSDSLDRAVSKAYLKHLFAALPKLLTSKRDSGHYPSFFYDYLELVQGAHHDRRKKKSLKDLETMFAQMVLDGADGAKEEDSPYQQRLLEWLNEQDDDLKPESWRAYKDKQATLQSAFAVPLSVLAGVFSALGTTFLLFETITIVPALAAISLNVWCVAVVPLALLAGSAYGLLTYNSTTDFMINNPFSNWFGKIKRKWDDDHIAESVVMGAAFSALCGLACALTICTAGTWMTIVDENSSIYRFITSLPKWVMGVVNPIVTTLSSLAFNLQNTSASLSLMMPFLMTPFEKIKHMSEETVADIKAVWARESWLQFVNPFRFLYQCLYEPLRRILFLGHLASIGVTSDRVPGFSKLGSACLGFVAEFGEDSHYFFGHECGGVGHSMRAALDEHLEADGHNHNLDLPTRFLEICLAPLELLRRGWNQCADWLVTPPISPNVKKGHHHTTQCCHGDHHEHVETAAAATVTPSSSDGWNVQHPIWFIDHYHRTHPSLPKDQSNAVEALLKNIKRVVKEKNVPENWHQFFHQLMSEDSQQVFPDDLKRKVEIRFA